MAHLVAEVPNASAHNTFFFPGAEQCHFAMAAPLLLLYLLSPPTVPHSTNILSTLLLPLPQSLIPLSILSPWSQRRQ